MLSSLLGSKEPTIKSIALTKLLKVFILSIVVVLAIVALSYRSFFQMAVEDKAIAVADIVKAGLTSHMKQGIMDKRGYFLDEIATVHDIKSLEVFRTPKVDSQFPSNRERVRSDIGRMPQFFWSDTQANVKAIIPYIASKEGGLNCLQCHHVQEGDILGGIEIEMDIESYQNFAIKYGYILAATLALFAIMIAFNMFHVIDKYITKPLLQVIDEGREAYIIGEDVSLEHYDSVELKQVVNNINNFNHDVLSGRKKLEQMNEEIDMTLQETLLAMGEMEEIRSKETRNHTKRVTKLSAMIAKAYGLDDERVRQIELASPLHDIGKMAIADAILHKPGRLSDDEYEKMKEHPTLGYNTLKHSERIILKTAAQIAYSHHEKYDGTGYPQGLKGEQIPLCARIVAVVDVLDALMCKRVYKEPWPKERVREFFIEQSGKHFDPKLVEVVLAHLDEYATFIEENS